MKAIVIDTKLTEMRIPTRGDKQEHVAKKYPKYAWRPATVRSILDQEAYTGTWYYGKTKMENGKQVPRDRDEWVPVSVPQIIDPILFIQAKEVRQRNFEMSPRSTKYKYLLRGRLKCEKCGYSYVGRTRREIHQYYYCKGREQSPLPLCDMPTFRADQVNDNIWAWIIEMILQPENLEAGLKETQQSLSKINERLIEQINIIDEQISSNKEKLEKLIDLVIEGDFPREMVASRRQEIERTTNELLMEIEKLSLQLSSESLSDDQIVEVSTFARSIKQGIRNADFETKRRIIDLLDVRGKLAVENERKVVYVTCKLGQQQRSLVQTSPLSNTGGTETRLYGYQPMARSQ